MPKLTADSLAKRFVCQYCGESVRSRQGLSGHIQWKHSDKRVVKEIGYDFLMSKMANYIAWKRPPDLQSINQAAARLIAGWHHVKSFCEIYDIELTKQDFKNYILTGFAQVFLNFAGFELATT